MSKISELSDGGALQSTDYLIAVRSGGNVKVRPNGAVSGTTGTFSGNLTVDTNTLLVDSGANIVNIGSSTNYVSGKLFVGGNIKANYSNEISMQYNVSGSTALYHKGMTGTSPETTTARGLHIFNHDNDSDEGIKFYSGAPSGTAYQKVNFKAGQTGEIVFNDNSYDQDFRVESDSQSHMLFVDASNNELTIGGNANSANASLALNTQSGKHGKAIGSVNGISGSNEFAIMAEGTIAVNTTSLGTKLSIPIFSQASVWRRYTVEMMFTSGEYNDSGNSKYGTATLKFASLTSISQILLAASTGNVGSVSSTGMNVEINFTSGYTGGLADFEGVLVYYRVLGSHPSYFQAWNATLN